ncbi:MAG TPA: Ig-like domain-containing protein [Acidobacteriaceae bacterium]|jgi:hypothetical protein|nr:Ig-like domain-containing protein [Acidobacteriaceae bacterium]
MPNSSSTVAVDSSQTTNTPAALGYGFIWATGKRAEYYMLQNTGSDALEFSRVGFWLLGEGEWDGCEELWINDTYTWDSEYDDPAQFHFHRGTDSVIGSGLTPYSIGPDQGCDQFWQWFPTALQPLCYSRLAYYGIFRKQPIENQTNDHENDPTQWTDIAPIGLWRGLRVRIFDDEGNQSGYAFSTNPVWHWVDVKLRRKLFPEYGVSLNGGADPVPEDVLNRFNWGDIYASATYCNQIIQTNLGSRPRFTGNYAFSQSTTLAAIEEQMLKVCRGFIREYAGQLSLIVDRPRDSVLTFTREHILPGSFAPSDKTLSSAPNSFIAKFRDLLVPAAANIATITCADHSEPIVTTEDPHPFNTGDRIAIGGTDTIYDGVWFVAGVPAGTNITTLTLLSKGSNYPASVGAGGVIGLTYSRFKERAPTFRHQANQYAKGAVGVGIPRQLNAVPVTYDFAVTTFDQASRVIRYEKDRALGYDAAPYVTPPAFTLKCPAYARDAAGTGAAAAQLQPGDVVTLDPTASFAYQGIYEVITRAHQPYTAQPAGSGNTVTLKASPDGGQETLTLQWFDGGYFYDSTDAGTAGWSNVPGSDPGNDGDYTAIALADNGTLAFLSLSLPTGKSFDLPSSGFDPANMLAWAGPQGTADVGNDMHVISNCSVDPTTRIASLSYEDGENNLWGGDVNVAAVTWIGDNTAADLTTAVIGTSEFNWLLLTLAGGEKVCFGQGVLADGTNLILPTGFDLAKSLIVAYPHDASPNEAGASGNQAHGVGAYVDSDGVVHLNYQDGEGHVWHGNANVLVFAWQNNTGTVTTQTFGGASWMLYNDATDMTLGVGMGTFADGSALTLPTAAGAGNSLQAIAGPRTFDIVDHPAHGIGACYVDANLTVHIFFEDGEGNQWSGTADVFALFYEPTTGASGGSAGGISVTVSPAGISMPVSGTQQFSAQVLGSSNMAVNWSVDGVAGGNADVGTIDATGLYTAPATNGTHQITAISQANAAAIGWQFVQVGTGSAGSTIGAAQLAITPSAAAIALSATQQFTATVTGYSGSPTIQWAVDGVTGGNATVGTIDGTGLYTAPGTSGGHNITALIVGAGVGSGATVSVGNPGAPGGGYTGGSPIGHGAGGPTY